MQLESHKTGGNRRFHGKQHLTQYKIPKNTEMFFKQNESGSQFFNSLLTEYSMSSITLSTGRLSKIVWMIFSCC